MMQVWFQIRRQNLQLATEHKCLGIMPYLINLFQFTVSYNARPDQKVMKRCEN
jgi:hypothetical protein